MADLPYRSPISISDHILSLWAPPYHGRGQREHHRDSLDARVHARVLGEVHVLVPALGVELDVFRLVETTREQGRTLVHLSAQHERFAWDRCCA